MELVDTGGLLLLIRPPWLTVFNVGLCKSDYLHTDSYVVFVYAKCIHLIWENV